VAAPTHDHPTCLDPAVAVLPLDEQTTQFGLDPHRHVVVEQGSSESVALLRALRVSDRPPTVPDESVPGAEAARPATSAMHDRLAAAGLLRCGGPWRDRAGTWVRVVGRGPAAQAVHAALCRLDLGRCDRSATLTTTAPHLVVVAPEHGRGSELSNDLQARGTPHMWAHTRDGRAVVGPLVSPGRSTCLRCMDLLLTERDPAWPRLVAQWEQSGAVQPAASVSLLAGLVAGQVQRWLTGEQHTCWGATLEEQPDGTVERRLWPMHPDCGCGWSRPGCPARPVPAALE
jgi:hypothetical protein